MYRRSQPETRTAAAAGEMEANALGRPSWTKLHEPSGSAPAERRPSAPRRALGRALIRIGRAIAAESRATAAG